MAKKHSSIQAFSLEGYIFKFFLIKSFVFRFPQGAHLQPTKHKPDLSFLTRTLSWETNELGSMYPDET